MNFKRHFIRIILVVATLLSQRVVAAASLPPHSWIKEYEKQKEYQYHEVKDTSSDSFWDAIDNWLANIIRKLFYSKGTSGFWSVFPYIAVVFVLVGLLWYFNKYGVNKIFGRSPSTFMQSGLLTDNIHDLDFDKLISEAEKSYNYRWAMRWRYLNYLKQLDEREIIKWQLHKTNADYRREIRHDAERTKFRNIARIYEDAWYGEWNADAADYKLFVELITAPVNRKAA